MKSTLFKDYRVRVLVVMILAVTASVGWYYINYNLESTDNASVLCEKIDITSELNGVINEINFIDNSYVEDKSFLVSIENSNFMLNVIKKRSELEAAKVFYKSSQLNHELLEMSLRGDIRKSKATYIVSESAVKSMSLSKNEAVAKLESLLAELEYSQNNYEENKILFEAQNISERALKLSKIKFKLKLEDKNNHFLHVKFREGKELVEKNKLNYAREELSILEESYENRISINLLEVDYAKKLLNISQAEYDIAILDLERTNITARRSGYVANRRVSRGDYVEIGQPIASIISCQENAWLEANFKETQISRMVLGGKVIFTFDTYPNYTFEGKIESLSRGSGSIFSVLPPENATGNFTKIVQRFPVRISVDDYKGIKFRMGMSAVVTAILD